MSFREVNVTVRAINHASHVFDRVATDATRMGMQCVMAVTSIASAAASLALAFGGASAEARAFATGIQIFSTIVSVAGTILTVFNIPLTWTVSLLTLGIGAIAAAAAAMAVLAMQTQSAANAQRNYNDQMSRYQGVYGRGEEQAAIRRGVEY